MDNRKIKVRQGHFERFSIPNDFVCIKMGIEKDEMDKLINPPLKETRTYGRRKRLDNMIRANNKTDRLIRANDYYGF